MSNLARTLAMKRLAFIFETTPEGIKSDDRFDVELRAAPPSDFRANEFDRVLEDIQQMRSATGLRSDEVVATAGQYCELADQYSIADPKGWDAMCSEWEKEQGMISAPSWRRAIWRLVGI